MTAEEPSPLRRDKRQHQARVSMARTGSACPRHERIDIFHGGLGAAHGFGVGVGNAGAERGVQHGSNGQPKSAVHPTLALVVPIGAESTDNKIARLDLHGEQEAIVENILEVLRSG